MRKFETQVQAIKYKTLREVARLAWSGHLQEAYYQIPRTIIPGPKASTRCCIYKERAIIEERVRAAMGQKGDEIVQVLEIACDECPSSGFTVSNHCRGCIAHRCKEVCPFDAIYFDEQQKAHIDKNKCRNCGLCAKACQYGAIMNQTRPCESACKVKAISMGKSGAAYINRDECISCGACVYQCPFGAITDQSQIVSIVDLIRQSRNNTKYKVYAIVAPSIASQFQEFELGKVIGGLKELGFYHVIEAALGGDIVALEEAQHFQSVEKMTSSCCPAFVSLIQKKQKGLKPFVSPSYSPMIVMGQLIKRWDTTAKVVFIGPCVAKKEEAMLHQNKEAIDAVMTFEELAALFDSRNLDLEDCHCTNLDNASYYGRIFARTGGLSDALLEACEELQLSRPTQMIRANGLDECIVELVNFGRAKEKGVFMEGMACTGGCLAGPCSLHHGPKDLKQVDAYGKLSLEKRIVDAAQIAKIQ